MPHFALGIARLVAVGLLISAALYGLERLIGWSELQSIIGAFLLIIGIFLAFGGSSSASHWSTKAKVSGITEHDISLFRRDSRQRFGSGINLIVIGAVVLALAVLLP